VERPIAKFGVGGLLGVVCSFSISFGLMALLAAFSLVVLLALAWRSHAALAGGLCGIGGTWLVVGGSTYMDCLARAPNCDPGGGSVPFLIVAGMLLVAGVLIAAVGLSRARAERRSGRA
jgi:hypothetical protein